jgi:membrane protease YdiL (CAAX protease family)
LLRFIRRLPLWVEAVVVLGMTFGVMMAAYLFDGMVAETRVVISDADLVSTLANWAVMAALAGGFLALRGCRLGDFSPRPSWKATAAGLLLFGLTWVLDLLVFGATEALGGGGLIRSKSFQCKASLPLILTVAVGNAPFEEMLWVGYVARVVRRGGPVAVALVSVALRTASHLYQGPLALLLQLPAGLLYVAAYFRGRTLWPLVVAHFLEDAVGLWSLRGEVPA